MTNSEKAEAYWEALASRWVDWTEHFKEVSAQITHKMLAHASLQGHEKILDLGAGACEPSISFAQALAAKNSNPNLILALDQSQHMLHYAQQSAGDLAIDFQQMRIQDWAFPQQQFDLVISRWGLMFLEDFPTVLDQIFQSLKPGGKLISSVWGEPEKTPMITLAESIFEQCFDRVFERPGPGPCSMADQAKLEAQFKSVGFTRFHSEYFPLIFPFDSARDYYERRAALKAPLAEAMEQKSQQEQAQYHQALERACQPWLNESGLKMPNDCFVIAAEKPAA